MLGNGKLANINAILVGGRAEEKRSEVRQEVGRGRWAPLRCATIVKLN